MLGRLATAAIAGLIATTGAAGLTQPAPTIQTQGPRKAKRGLFNGRVTPGQNLFRHSYLNHGPNAAQVKRASKKRRNVARHKAHVRG